MAFLYPKKIILHCSATEDSGTVSWGAIKRYHTETKGWSYIGYHYGIELVGSQLVYLQGRLPTIMGAHCRAEGRNRDSLGVCVVGNYDTKGPDQTRFDATVKLLANLCFVFQISPDFVYGHSEYEPMKTCPGRMWDMDLVRDSVRVALMECEEYHHFDDWDDQ